MQLVENRVGNDGYVNLRADVRMIPGTGLEVDDWMYGFEGVSETSLRTLVAYADGSRSVSELRALSGEREDLIPLLEAITQEGLARQVTTKPSAHISPGSFTAICRNVFPAWKARIFREPLWTGLADGRLSSAAFFGWLLESYHFIEGANRRLPYAVSFCFNDQARAAFAHHYGEEYDHGTYYLRALETLGVAADDAMDSEPLLATTALLNQMRRSARSDPLAYAVCSGFLESTGEDRVAGREFLQRIDKHFGLDASVAGPLLEHLQLDEDYGHNGLLEETCELFGHLTLGRASAALDAGFRLVETLEYWSASILEIYGASSTHRMLPETSRAMLADFTRARSNTP